jgi:hypothetical protein
MRDAMSDLLVSSLVLHHIADPPPLLPNAAAERLLVFSPHHRLTTRALSNPVTSMPN